MNAHRQAQDEWNEICHEAEGLGCGIPSQDDLPDFAPGTDQIHHERYLQWETN